MKNNEDFSKEWKIFNRVFNSTVLSGGKCLLSKKRYKKIIKGMRKCGWRSLTKQMISNKIKDVNLKHHIETSVRQLKDSKLSSSSYSNTITFRSDSDYDRGINQCCCCSEH